MAKFVVSTTLDNAEWNNSTLLKDNVAEAVSKLKQRPGGDILVNGSAKLVQTLMRHDLIADYRLMVLPVMLGRGTRLFGGEIATTDVRLMRIQQVGPAGVVVLTYTRACADVPAQIRSIR